MHVDVAVVVVVRVCVTYVDTVAAGKMDHVHRLKVPPGFLPLLVALAVDGYAVLGSLGINNTHGGDDDLRDAVVEGGHVHLHDHAGPHLHGLFRILAAGAVNACHVREVAGDLRALARRPAVVVTLRSEGVPNQRHRREEDGHQGGR
jgi:hypothetical protein